MTVHTPLAPTRAPATTTTNAVMGGELPAGVVVSLAAGVALATIAGWLGWAVLANPPAAGALLLVSGVLGGVAVLRLRARQPSHGGRAALALALPALGVLVPTLVGVVRGAPSGMEWVLNADHTRHAVYVADTWVQGNLSYGIDGYPRGWHALLAAAWSVIGAALDAASVTRLLRLMALASMMLSCLLALATAHLGHGLAAKRGCSMRTAVLVGLLAGSVTLLTTFLGDYQVLGYENSLLTAVVVVVCVREVLLRAGSDMSLLVCGAGTVVVAHSWQLLLPPVAAAGLYCAWRALRSRGRRAGIPVAASAVAAVVLGAPAVFGVLNGVGFGLDHSMEVGPESPVPVVLLALGVGVTVVLATRSRDRDTHAAAFLTLLPAATAVALSAVMGISVLDYYPNKMLWQSLVLTVPWLALSASLLVAGVRRRLPGASVVIQGVSSALFVVFVAFALVQPWAPQFGVWSTADGGRALGALRAPGAKEATVVWLEGSPLQDAITRSLLDVLRVADTRQRAPQEMLSTEEECELLGRADRPVVLSTAAEAVVRQRYLCVPDTAVVHVTPVR